MTPRTVFGDKKNRRAALMPPSPIKKAALEAEATERRQAVAARRARRRESIGLPAMRETISRRVSLGGATTVNSATSSVTRAPSRRLSMKRSVNEEEVDQRVPTITCASKPKPVQVEEPKVSNARKHRRLTLEASALSSFGARPKTSQRRISDVMDTVRASPSAKGSPSKSRPQTPKKSADLSPKSAAIKKLDEISTLMTPERMITRANAALMRRSSTRRRTLA